MESVSVRVLTTNAFELWCEGTPAEDYIWKSQDQRDFVGWDVMSLVSGIGLSCDNVSCSASRKNPTPTLNHLLMVS